MDPTTSLFDGAISGLFDPENLGAVVATVSSGVFALVSFWSQVKATRKAEEAESRLTELQREGLRASLDRQVIRWGSEAIGLLAEGERLARHRDRTRGSPEWVDACDSVAARLSALVDQGRLFFPNVSHDLVGLDRPYANRGYRPPILDALMLVHDRLRRILSVPGEDPTGGSKALFDARRAFVSELQRALDPRRRDVIFKNQEDNSHLERRDHDEDWGSVVPLVDAYEAEFGKASFWRDRPQPRRAIDPGKRGG